MSGQVGVVIDVPASSTTVNHLRLLFHKDPGKYEFQVEGDG